MASVNGRRDKHDDPRLREWLDTHADPNNIFGVHYPKSRPGKRHVGALLHHDGHIIGLDRHLMKHRDQWQRLRQYKACTSKSFPSPPPPNHQAR